MEKPTTISFTGLDLRVQDALGSKEQPGPAPDSYTSVRFIVPDGWSAPESVVSWLIENCPGRFIHYHRPETKEKHLRQIMVVMFEDKNDALLFKLKGGHQAWDLN